MKWSFATTSEIQQLPPDHPAVPKELTASGAKCPVDHASLSPPPPPPAAAAKCPVDHASLRPPAPVTAAPAAAGAKCPVDHASMASGSRSSAASASASASASGSAPLNPLNSMPIGLSAVDRAPGQVLDLPTERTSSTIPRPKTDDPDSGGVWEYPSPQQFYNALVRKGWETPEDSIETVVDIHNFINEAAWDEVMKWEKRLPNGENAQLARFQGRPGQLSPKARFHLWAGSLFPSKFNTEPPFDRHDWIVTRPPLVKGEAEGSTRYVIDYYSAPPDEDGNPVFSLDVRPALDSFQAVSLRLKVAVEEWLAGEQ